MKKRACIDLLLMALLVATVTLTLMTFMPSRTQGQGTTTVVGGAGGLPSGFAASGNGNQILGPSGTAAAPSYSFSGSPTSGMFVGGGGLSFSVNGFTSLTVTSGGLGNQTGLQSLNTTTTCTTAATINTPCTTAAISLPVGYSDTNYRIICNGLPTVTAFPQIQTITKSNTTFTITVNNLTAAAASYGSFDCIATHN